jgi:hypothetical protein
MTPQGAQVLAGVAAVFAALGLYGFLSRMGRERAVGDTPLVRVRSAAQGYVKVVGRAQPLSGTVTAAPLSGRPCVWWDIRVGAECLIGPVQAEVTPSSCDLWYGSSRRPDGPPPPANTAVHAGQYQYQERIIAAGAELCVVGEFRSHSESGNATAAIAAKLHEWKQDQQTLLARFDADHDGVLNAAEWEAARAAAASECDLQSLSGGISRVSVISKPIDGRPFLIAPLTPERLERRESSHAWGYLLFGCAWIVVCAWALSRALS